MENIFPRCAGLDVHKESVEPCVRRMEPSGHLQQQTRHWGTMTRDLLAMADRMAAQGVTHVAMESTGVYWKPIYNILESRFTVLLGRRGKKRALVAVGHSMLVIFYHMLKNGTSLRDRNFRSRTLPIASCRFVSSYLVHQKSPARAAPGACKTLNEQLRFVLSTIRGGGRDCPTQNHPPQDCIHQSKWACLDLAMVVYRSS